MLYFAAVTLNIIMHTPGILSFDICFAGRARQACELRDGGDRYMGKGVLQAVKNVNEVLGPLIGGMDPTKQQEIDDVSVRCLLAMLSFTPIDQPAVGSAREIPLAFACSSFRGGVGTKVHHSTDTPTAASDFGEPRGRGTYANVEKIFVRVWRIHVVEMPHALLRSLGSGISGFAFIFHI